jgi:hypothetical protein
MAEDKKSFLLYCDLINTVKKLPKNKQGELFVTILEYVNDLNPKVKDLSVDLVFEPIKLQLKRDLIKYEEKKGKKSISGREGNLKRWHLDLYNEYKDKKHTLDKAESIAESRKVSQPDKVRSQSIANIAVTDTVTVTVTDTVSIKENFTHESFLIWFKECRNYLGLQFNVKRLSTMDKQLFNELKEYTKEDFKLAFKNFSKDKYYKENNLLFPNYFLKTETFTKYLNAEVKTELTLGEKLMGRVQ